MERESDGMRGEERLTTHYSWDPLLRGCAIRDWSRPGGTPPFVLPKMIIGSGDSLSCGKYGSSIRI